MKYSKYQSNPNTYAVHRPSDTLKGDAAILECIGLSGCITTRCHNVLYVKIPNGFLINFTSKLKSITTFQNTTIKMTQEPNDHVNVRLENVDWLNLIPHGLNVNMLHLYCMNQMTDEHMIKLVELFPTTKFVYLKDRLNKINITQFLKFPELIAISYSWYFEFMEGQHHIIRILNNHLSIKGKKNYNNIVKCTHELLEHSYDDYV